MESVYMNARLLAEQLVQVLNKADDNDDGGACQPDEKEIRQQVHSVIDEWAHMSILPRPRILGPEKCLACRFEMVDSLRMRSYIRNRILLGLLSAILLDLPFPIAGPMPPWRA